MSFVPMSPELPGLRRMALDRPRLDVTGESFGRHLMEETELDVPDS
jgi:hypothetical protein